MPALTSNFLQKSKVALLGVQKFLTSVLAQARVCQGLIRSVMTCERLTLMIVISILQKLYFKKNQMEDNLPGVLGDDEQFTEKAGLRIVLRCGVGHMPVLDWSDCRLSNLLTALPRMVLI